MINATIAKKETEKNRIKRNKKIEKEINKDYKKTIKIISRKIIKEIKNGSDKCVVTILYRLTPMISDYFTNLGFNVKEESKYHYFDFVTQLKITWEDKN